MRLWLPLCAGVALVGCAPTPHPAPPPGRDEARSPAPPIDQAATRGSAQRTSSAHRPPAPHPLPGSCHDDLQQVRPQLANLPPPANAPYLAMFGVFEKACARARSDRAEHEAVRRAIRASALWPLVTRQTPVTR